MKTFLPLLLLLLSALPALAQRFPRVANTLADMVASNPNVVHTNVFVADVNRGGMFFWLAGSTLTTNAGTVYPSTYPGVTGRYFREVTGPLDVRWFGATVGDATDDSVAGQAALDLASTSTNSNEVLFRPGGTGGYIMGNLIAKSNVRMRGAAYINIPAAATNFLSISNVINVEVRDLTVYANSTNHTAFWLANDAHEISFNKVFVTGTPIWSGRATWSGNGPYAWVIQRSYINEWVSCSAEFMGTEVWFNSDNAHRNTFLGCSFKNANLYNVLATINGAQVNSTGHDNTFLGCDIEGPSTFVRLTAAEVNFSNCYFEGPSTAVRQIEIDGDSIVTIANSYMWDTYLGFGSTSGVAAGLTLRENIWDGIGSSTTSPFIRYTSDSSAPLIIEHNKAKSAVVIYRSGQWWNGTIWQDLTNNEEEIRDSNLFYDPVALVNRRAYSSGPFLDSQRFNHPLGVNRYPDNALGLALKVTANPTNAANAALLTWENAYVSAGYFSSGIDISNRLAFRWWPSSNSSIFALESDLYAALPLVATNSLLHVGLYNRLLPVTIGTGLTFNAGVLDSTGGGGATNAITQLNGLTNASQTLVDGGFSSSSSVVSAGTVHTFSTSTNFPMLSVSNNINMGRESLTGTTPAINWATQQTKVWALSANSTPTFSNTPTDTNFTRTISVVVTNTTFTIDWDDTVYWPPTDAEVNPMTNTVTTYVFKWDGVRVLGYADQLVSGGSGSGTVTSVAATVPGGFSIAGSPVTTSGTLAIEASGEQPYYFLRGNFDGSSIWDNSLVYSNSNDTVAASFGSVKRGRAGDATGSPASGGILGQYRVGGWNTSANVLGGGLSGFATENWTATANGHDLRFYVISNTTAVTSLAMTIGQDRKVRLESASTANSFLGTDGNGNIVITNAPAGGGGAATAWQQIGTGTDFIYTGTAIYEKVSFGTSGPSIVLTNAGTYQIIMTVAATANNTFSQGFYLTNITDGVSVPGSIHDNNVSSSIEAPTPINVIYTTTAANKTIELWGYTMDPAPAQASVTAIRTVADVIRLDNLAGSGGSGTPGGSNTQVQFNDASAFGGDAGFTYTKATDALTIAGRLTLSGNSAASTSMEIMTGTWFTGGTTTTTRPHFLIEPTGTTSTTWDTDGTGFGMNAASGFVGNLFDFQVNNTSKLKVDMDGDLTATGNITLGSNKKLIFSTRSLFSAPSSGTIIAGNSTSTGFTALQLGYDDAAPDAMVTVRPGGGIGTDIAGGGLTIAGGPSSGTGAGGSILFQTSPAGGAGATTNALATHLTIDSAGNVIVTAASTLRIPNGAAPTTDAVGELALDTTITDHQPLLQYFSSAGEMLVPAIFRADLPTTDNYVLTYDAVQDSFVFEAQAGGGGATAWNDIGDATGIGTIALGGFETDFTSTIDVAGEAVWTLTNTDADAANDNSLIDLKHNDGADANVFYMRMIGDADGTPSNNYLFSQTTFTIGSTILTLIGAGTTTAPSLASSTATTTGLNFASGNIGFTRSGTSVGVFGNTSLTLNGRSLAFDDSLTVLDKESNGVFQFGSDAASPATQILKGPDGLGSNIATVNNRIGPGRSTGAGTPAHVQVEVGTTGAAASSQNAYATAVGIGGTLKVDTTTTGNTGSGEDDLVSYSIPAGQLSKDGSFIEFDVFGTFAANANTAQLKVFFDGVAFFDTTSLLFNGVAWRGHGKIIRTGAATQKISIEFTVGGTLLSAVNSTVTAYATDNATLSGATIFKITGQDTGGVPADNKVVQEGMVLKWYPGQ